MSARNTWAKTVALGAATVLTLSACGGDDGGSGADGDVTLRFTWWGSDSRHSATEEIIAAFEDENPGITIQGEPGDWGGYWDKLATQVAASDAPDIIQMDEKYIREYADRGALLDLQDVDTSAMTDSTVATGTMDAGQVGIPTGINAITLLANPAVFEAAGVEMPDDTTWTWDDYAETAKQVEQNSEYHGATTPNEPTGFQIWLRQQGKELSDDEGALGFEAADAQEYFEMLLGWLEDGALPEASILSEDQGPGPDESLTGTGQVAMGPWWTNQIAALSGASGEGLVPLRFPSTDGSEGGAQLYYKSSMFMSANGQTEHPEEAQQFIDYMVNSEEAGMVNLADRGLPANLDVREAVVPELGAADAEAADFLNEIEDELGPDLPIPPLGFSALQDILYRYEMEIFFGDMTPAEAAEQMLGEMETSIG